MTTVLLRTKRAIDADNKTTPSAFDAVRAIAPNIADRLDEAAIEKATAEDELSYVNERLRRLHPPAVFKEHLAGHRSIDFDDLDELDRRVPIADLEGQRLDVSRRVRAARESFNAVRLEGMNALLYHGSADWTERETTMVAQRRVVEKTLGQLVSACMVYGQACEAERRAAGALLAVAREAVVGDEARQAVSIAARTGEVAVAIGEDGFADTVERPERGLFGAEHIDFAELGRTLELAFTDPERAAKQLAGTALGKTIETTR